MTAVRALLTGRARTKEDCNVAAVGSARPDARGSRRRLGQSSSI